MADHVNINGGKSAAEVALTLLQAVAQAESKFSSGTFYDCDRTYILDAYAECLKAAQGYRN